MSSQTSARTGTRLAVDWTACDGRGLCAELLPELIDRDDWGFPLIASDVVPPSLVGHARRAVTACPMLALRLEHSRRP
jgi:ferredoxin